LEPRQERKIGKGVEGIDPDWAGDFSWSRWHFGGSMTTVAPGEHGHQRKAA
jgi:hypothetical protein